MTRPRKKDLSKFDEYDVQQFAEWFRGGLEGFYIDLTGVRTFAPFEYCILNEHTLWADLQAVYEAFSSEQRTNIRKAIAFLMADLPVEVRYAPVFRLLLDLATAINATEVLKVIPARGEGFLILDRENPQLPSLYERALDVVVELGRNTTVARACIERLIGTPSSFSFDHARTALVALCRIAPDDFAVHMDLLRAPLARNMNKYRPTDQAQYWTALDIVKATGLVVIKNSWIDLHIVEEPDRVSPNDNWFYSAILPLLDAESNESVRTVFLKDEPDIRVTVTVLLGFAMSPREVTVQTLCEAGDSHETEGIESDLRVTLHEKKTVRHDKAALLGRPIVLES